MKRTLIVVTSLMLAAGVFGDTFGWRGDGTGRFPDADPPVVWGKVSKVLSGLRCRAEKPRGDGPAGVPAYTGALTEWLVLGPLPVKDAKTGIDEALVKDEASCEPDAGEKVKGRAWKKITVPGTTVDFSPRFANDNPTVEYVPYHEYHIYKVPLAAYAHTYLYSAGEGTVRIRIRAASPAKVWLNGEVIYPTKKAIVVGMKKGWNRILVKVVNKVYEKKPGVWTATPFPSPWYFDLSLTATWPFETETRNIRWATALPSHGVASPVIVGNRVFVMAEPGRLICVDKRTGKILWDRAPSFWDTLSVKGRKDPAFKDVTPLAARLKTIRAALRKPGKRTPELAAERNDLIKKIASGMKKVDAKKYTVKRAGHGNCLPTPVSDGESIYLALGNGLAARYDLDGTLKWATRVSPGRNQEHGVTNSPALAGGKPFDGAQGREPLDAARGHEPVEWPVERLIVFHIDLAGLDAKTGKIDWKVNIWRKKPFYGDLTHQTPVAFRVEGKDYVYIYGEIIRVSDGNLVWDGGRAWKEKQVIPTPIIEDGVLYDFSSSGRLRVSKLPTSGEKIALDKPATGRTFSRVLGASTRGFLCASPLYHEGLLYAVDCMGTLFVLDAKTLKTVYRRDLGVGFETRSVVHTMGTAYASPVLAGKHIYVFGMHGTTVVFKPGREYEEVARNRIEDITTPRHWREKPEGSASAPVAEGRYLYVRGDKYLYCIGK